MAAASVVMRSFMRILLISVIVVASAPSHIVQRAANEKSLALVFVIYEVDYGLIKEFRILRRHVYGNPIALKQNVVLLRKGQRKAVVCPG
jgi:hypothetical protein